MKVFNRRNVLKGGLVGSMAAGFASFVGASHAAEPAAKAPAQNDKNTYDVIVLGAGWSLPSPLSRLVQRK